MSAAGVALFLLASAFREVPCWGLFFVVAAVAWPIWHYQRDVVLFERRAVLAGVAVDDSWVRRRFWAGHLTQVLQVFVALAWAALLLALAGLLGPEAWAVLAADVLLLSLIVGPVQRRVARQVRDGQVGAFSRRWPLWAFNLLFLTLAFSAVDFFLAGAPDTRDMAWQAVAEAAFARSGLDAACAPAGWLVGALAGVEALAWHASQLVIPSLPGPASKLVAWAFVLMHAGLVAYLFTRLQLGVVALLDCAPRGSEGRGGDSAFSLAFLYTILFLALPYLYVTLKLDDFDPAPLEDGARRVVEWVNPCATDPAARAALLGTLGEDLERERAAARVEAEQAVDAALERLFAEVEQGVDRYLDWYFTVIGEYERLLASMAGDFAVAMSERLEHELFGATRVADRLDEASRAIEAAAADRLAAAAERLGRQAAAAVEGDPCRLEGVSLDALGDLDRDRTRVAVAATGGTAAGVVTAKLLAQNAGAAVAAKVATKNTFKVAAAAAGKVTAKKGGSILLSATAATAVCAPGGPLAVLCGVAAGAVTWLTIDKLMVEVDEALFRDEMRAELMATVEEQRAALAQALKAQHGAAIDGAAIGIQARIDSLFVPARDGL
jgi:hypothetical protein